MIQFNAIPATEFAQDKVRVLVVDDSLVIRGLISRLLKDHSDIEVVGSVANGALAIDRVARRDVDIVILDIEMPIMDGLTALPKLLAANPKVAVIMASTLTTRNADISLKALRLGASDYVPKPTTSTEIYNTIEFREELVRKVLALGRRRLRMREAKLIAGGAKPLAIRPPGTARPQALAIGSSTGGPQALHQFLSALPRDLNVPVLITQHMPPTFTGLLAGQLARDTGWAVAEAKDGEELRPRVAFMAPGDFHMRIVTELGRSRIKLNKEPKENYCRPSVDPMLRSLAAAFGAHLLVVMLTGMGQDGLDGSKAVVGAGGTVIAQDEASSVVWGMPGAVATAGLCARVAPIPVLAETCANLCQGRPL